MKIDFIIPGAAKSGTTSLVKYLNLSQKIYIPDFGYELNFFSKNKYYKKGFDWYHSFFNVPKSIKYLGEHSNQYMCSQKAIKRIYDYNKNINLIFILRNPMKRAVSHYNANIQKGTEYLPFLRALKNEKFRKKLGGFFNNNYSYLQRGLYYEQLIEFLKYFQKENIHIVIFEEFISDIKSSLLDIYEFLGIPKIEIDRIKLDTEKKRFNITYVPKSKITSILILLYYRLIGVKGLKYSKYNNYVREIENKNKTKLKPYSPHALEIQYMQNYFETSITNLEKLLNKDLSLWRKY